MAGIIRQIVNNNYIRANSVHGVRFSLLLPSHRLLVWELLFFLPAWTIFELEFGDGRSYEKQSLSRVVAGRTALYHHGDEPFSSTMRSLTHARFIGPSLVSAAGAAPQDDSNYLRRLVLTPGCRIESGLRNGCESRVVPGRSRVLERRTPWGDYWEVKVERCLRCYLCLRDAFIRPLRQPILESPAIQLSTHPFKLHQVRPFLSLFWSLFWRLFWPIKPSCSYL